MDTMADTRIAALVTAAAAARATAIACGDRTTAMYAAGRLAALAAVEAILYEERPQRARRANPPRTPIQDAADLDIAE